jgi:1-acyl-sn-glycerol-3-phosphate acyltransferase
MDYDLLKLFIEDNFMSLRTIILFPCIMILTLGFSLGALFAAFLDRSGHWSHRVASLWATTLLKVTRVKVEISHLEDLNPDQAYIFAANHQSAFDILALLSKLKVQFRWLAKDSLFTIPIFGWAMKRTGYIPINRSNAKQAYQSLLQAAQKIKEGNSVVIFPEGTRQQGDHLGSFKKGGFVLSLKSKQPIVPISILGSGRILPKKGFNITPGTIRIFLGKPIPTKDYHPKEAEILMEKVREAIEKNLTDEGLKTQSSNPEG